ncbi:MAG: alpha-galactosidase [Chitinivibrionales bacterium]|nr:alpha-galactosidase [Chitinivibrionales bacterium]
MGPKSRETGGGAVAAFPAYCTAGMNDWGETAMSAVHADGNTSTDLRYLEHASRPLDENITLTKIGLKDGHYDFFVDMFFKAYDNENIIEQWVEIRQAEKKAVTLYDFASSQLTLRAGDFWLTQFAGDWGNEMNLIEECLTRGTKIIASKLLTRATRFVNPSFIVSLSAPASEDTGEVLGASLAWPGNFSLRFEITNEGDLRIISGMNPIGSHYKLEAGTVFATPPLVFSYNNNGIGHISRNFHCWARKYGIRQGDKAGSTVFNNWETTGFDFNEKKLAGLMAEAAQAGLELFLLDDGWFGAKHPRDGDAAGLGDWAVNAKKLPGGISYLVKEAARNGIKLGLWIEPEMVNPPSELFEQHPDWVLAQPYRAHDLVRNQLVLDLTNPAVQEFILKVVDGLLNENPGIKYLKWDCNRQVTHGGSMHLPPEEQSHLWIEYPRALMSLFSKVSKSHPDVVMMLCSAGGGRLEYGSLQYFHEYWPSDNTDALQRLFIQWGCSYFFPAISICTFVSGVPHIYTGRSMPLKFRFDAAMAGKLGMDLPLSGLSVEELEFTKRAIAEYKRLRDVIMFGDLFRLVSPYEKNFCSMLYGSQDQSRAIFFCFLLHRHLGETYPPIKLKGIGPDKKYLVREVNRMPDSKSAFGEEKLISGEELVNQGINLNFKNEYDSIVLELTEK